MGKEIRLMVTQPVHGSHGDLIHQPGEMFPLGTELGPDVRVTEVIVDVPDAPEARPRKGDGDAAGQDGESTARNGDDAPAGQAPAAVKPSPPPARPGGSRGTRSSTS